MISWWRKQCWASLNKAVKLPPSSCFFMSEVQLAKFWEDRMLCLSCVLRPCGNERRTDLRERSEDVFLHSEDTVELGQTCLLRVSWFSGLDCYPLVCFFRITGGLHVFSHQSGINHCWAVMQQWIAYWGFAFSRKLFFNLIRVLGFAKTEILY